MSVTFVDMDKKNQPVCLGMIGFGNQKNKLPKKLGWWSKYDDVMVQWYRLLHYTWCLRRVMVVLLFLVHPQLSSHRTCQYDRIYFRPWRFCVIYTDSRLQRHDNTHPHTHDLCISHIMHAWFTYVAGQGMSRNSVGILPSLHYPCCAGADFRTR